jgi:hypothetical protein
MPRPSSSTVQLPRAKSAVTVTLEALASREFLRSSRTTPVSDTMVVEDLIWAATPSGKGRIDMMLSTAARVHEQHTASHIEV